MTLLPGSVVRLVEAEVDLFGGTAGITYDPSYHTALDAIDNVGAGAVEIMSKAIAHATLSLAQDTSQINGKHSAGRSGKPHPTQDGVMPSEEDVA